MSSVFRKHRRAQVRAAVARPVAKPKQFTGLLLTWQHIRDGKCLLMQESGVPCGNVGPLYAPLEHVNPDEPPICARCLAQVEQIVAERRARKGLLNDSRLPV